MSSILYFGDQTVDTAPSLRTLFAKAKTSPALHRFFDDALRALHLAVLRLPADDRAQVPLFRTVLDFADAGSSSDNNKESNGDGGGATNTGKKEKNVVVATLALCLAQLGDYIYRAERDPTILARSRSSSTSSASPNARRIILGVCTGLLPAAAAAVATSLAELAQVAREIVLVALRLGVQAHRRAAAIERGPGGGSSSWSVAVGGCSVDDIRGVMEEFHAGNSTPKHKQVYISASFPSGVTISGPPSVLQDFLTDPRLASVRKLSLPIAAAFHASHLAAPNVAAIVSPITTTSSSSSSSPLTLPLADDTVVISPGAAAPYSFPSSSSSSSQEEGTATTLRDLLVAAVDDIFQREVRHGKAVSAAAAEMALVKGEEEVTIAVFGPTNSAEKFLRQAAQDAGLRIRIAVGEDNSTSSGQSASPNGISPSPSMSPPLETGMQDAIAIIGMSGRFPGSEDVEGLWELLREGRDLHKQVPADRFDVDLHCDPSGRVKNATLSAIGCFIDRPGMFDNRLFNMSPREAAQTDPCQRLLLMTTYEALEDAGFRGDSGADSVPEDGNGNGNGESGGYGGGVGAETGSTGRERVATFVGVTADDWREYNIGQDIDMYYVTGGLRAFASGRLNYHFKWDGPSYALDTACSSSAAAIQLACASLAAGDSDMAVAGGATVLTGPNLWTGLTRAGFVSPTGGSKTFDDSADGYCRGDGVAVVVLKRLADALANNDPIRGVIRGVGTNHSARAPSITQPHAPSQRGLYERVLRAAGLGPADVDYIEMHGTGTQVGDAIEMTSVVDTFGRAAGRAAEKPLYVGGVKANIGHGEAAAGVTSVIKSLLMFRENAIPPHAGIKTRINSKFPPLADFNIRIPTGTSATPFTPLHTRPRRILVSSFGATGGNTCMLIEEPPARQPPTGPAPPHKRHVVALSAKTATSLQGNRQRLLGYLSSHPEVRIQDVAYTTTARRMHHALRQVFCVSDVDELVRALPSDAASVSPAPPSSSDKPSAVFLFPGQGFRFAGLSRVLFDTCPTFRATLSELDATAIALGLPSFLPVVLAGEDRQGKDASKDTNLAQSHLALVAIEISFARLLRLWGIVPRAVIGHSLGEYAALCTAGVLTVPDTLLLVGRRAELVEANCGTPGAYGMLAVQADEARVRDLLALLDNKNSTCAIACLNAPQSTVVNGSCEDLAKLQQVIIAQGSGGPRCTLLPTPYAFHSAQLDPALEEYRAVASSVRFLKPTIPVASTLLGRLVSTTTAFGDEEEEQVFTPDYIVNQTRQPVRFEAALRSCHAAGLITDKTLLVETGPGAMCLAMARATFSGVPQMKKEKLLPCLQAGGDSCWETLPAVAAQAYASGFTVRWSDYYAPYEDGGQLVVLDLPSYCFDQKDFWIQFRGGVAALERKVARLEADVASAQKRAVAAEEAAEVARREAGSGRNTNGMNGGGSGGEEKEEAPPPLSMCLHRVDSESISPAERRGTVEFSSDLREPVLRSLIAGHAVIGLRLAPSSVYADMAFAGASYLYSRIYGSSSSSPPVVPGPGMDMQNLTISAPLALRDTPGPQLVKVRVSIDEPGSAAATVRFSAEHGETAKCEVRFLEGGEQKWVRDWARRRYLVQERAAQMMAEAGQEKQQGPENHRFLRDMVYKIFEPLTDYSPEYHSVETIYVNREFREAAARLDLRPHPPAMKALFASSSSSVFASDPCRLDVIAQVAGFMLNSSIKKPDDVIYMSTGWDSMRVSTAMVGADAACRFTCHVRAEVTEDGGGSDGPAGFMCDATVMDDTRVVALAEGLAFKRVKKSVLYRMLGLPVPGALAGPAGAAATKKAVNGAAQKPVQNGVAARPTLATPAAAAAGVQVNGYKKTTTTKKTTKKVKKEKKEKKPKKPKTSSSSNGGIYAAVLALVAEETGSGVEEMTDSATLEDLGVDSLMTVSITSRLKKEMSLELPTALLLGTTTIADLREHFGGANGAVATSGDVLDDDDDDNEDDDEDDDEEDEEEEEDDDDDELQNGEMSSSSAILTPPTPAAERIVSSSVSLESVLVEAIARETGMETDEIDARTSTFSDLGVDSLMSIAVAGIVRERTGVEVPASVFADCETVAEVVERFGGKVAVEEEAKTNGQAPSPSPASSLSLPSSATQISTSTSTSTSTTTMTTSTTTATTITNKTKTKTKKRPLDDFHSNAVLLQGNPARTDLPRLFLLTEGSGSAACYIHMPPLATPEGRALVVYALESPWLNRGEDFDYDMAEVCSLFARAIRGVQPKGPYLIGGWSIGGMYAYETAWQIVQAGEYVHSLLLIDAACPRPMEGLPPLTVDLLEETGMFEGMAIARPVLPRPTKKKNNSTREELPSYELTPEQKRHVLGCVKAVADYDPRPMPPARQPAHSFVIWSRFGLFEKLALKVKEAGDLRAEQRGLDKVGVNQDWLTAERTSFGPKGWDRLLGPGIECFSVEGDHFSCMQLPRIKNITGPLVKKLVQRSLANFDPSLSSAPATAQSKSNKSTPTPTPLLVSPARVRAAFEDTRTMYSDFAKETGYAGFWTHVYPVQKRLVLAYIIEAYAKLGIPLDKMAPGTPVPVPPSPAVLPKHALLVDLIADILVEEGLVERRAGPSDPRNSVHRPAFRTAKPVDTSPAASSVVLHGQITRDFPNHANEHELLRVMAEKLAECLTGTAEPLRILFAENRAVLQDFYTNAPMFVTASLNLAAFFRRAYSDLLSSHDNADGVLEVLEIGAGLGGTTRFILEALRDTGARFRYTYTDVSTTLVASARQRFAKNPALQLPPGCAVEFSVLDVTKPLAPALRGKFHAALSSNCVHATPNLTASTANARAALRPGGVLALIELTYPQRMFDLVFGFLDGWWNSADGRTHPLTNTGLWKKSLEAAGYEHVAWSEAGPEDERLNPVIIVALNPAADGTEQ